MSSNIIVKITANGTDNTIHTNHNTDHHISIAININRGLTHNAWFITNGTNMLFSVHCII